MLRPWPRRFWYLLLGRTLRMSELVANPVEWCLLHELQNSLTEAKRKAEIYDKMSALINSRM